MSAVFLGSGDIALGQKSAPERQARRKVVFGMLGCGIFLSLGLASVLQSHPMRGWAAFGFDWLGVAGIVCLPISAWWVRRAAKAEKSGELDDLAVQTQLQVEFFRATRRDSLTGLPSRPAFMEILSGLVAHDRPAALLVLDLDAFGTLNATHGDGTGDELLRAFADRLRTIAGHREHVSRLDGDEFALLLDRVDELRDLEGTVAKVLRTLTEPYPTAGSLLDVPVSIGVARAPEHGTTTETLLRAARLALRQAKTAGGATWRLCGQDESALLSERDQFRAELSQAIETGQIIPWYQPVVSLSDNRIAKFEVLARWNHPELGLLEPEKFIHIAEELGLLAPLSSGLLKHVAQDMEEWPEWCRFSINVSAAQLRQLIGFVRSQPGDWQRRMDLSRLDVEITETALIRDRAMARELIDALHDVGARAGLDDFGNGYSNMFHLREMPVDFIKIGKAFVSDLVDDNRAESCVMAMLWLGHGLDIDMVADGVESVEVAERLKTMGCQFAQGFLYSYPVPAAGVGALLRESVLAQQESGPRQ